MAPTYTSAVKVSQMIGALTGDGTRMAFGVSTMPTLAEVEALIELKEAEIDERTNNSWKLNSSVERFNHPGFSYDKFGEHSVIVRLFNRSVRALDAGESDKVEIWDGSTWTDIIANEGEAAGEDYFFVDYEAGMIHFYHTAIKEGYKTIKITYRYGETSIPASIEQACSLMVASHFMEIESLMMIPEGASEFNLSKRDILYRWDKEIRYLLNKYTGLIWV